MRRAPFGVLTRFILSLVIVGLLAIGNIGQASAATILYVKYNATGANNGTSWANAYKSLQAALSAAKSGQQIWVAKGTYKPTTTNARTANFRLKNGVAIYGGFAGNETSLGQRKPTVNVTILSGDVGVVGKANDNSYHVVVGGGTNNTAILDGFTIRGGRAVNAVLTSQLSGAGIYNVNSSPTLRNLVFTLNTAQNQGGGMYNSGSNPVLVNVTFTSNTGGSIGGGGTYNDHSSPRLTNVKFINNTAGTDGGGMYNNNFSGPSNPVLNNVTFSGNSALNGGGLDNHGSSPVLTNVTFSGNHATTNGGGLFNNVSSNPSLNAVTFSGNTAVDGGGMYNNDASAPTISNVTFSANTASGSGGGMANQNSNPSLKNVTFSSNAASISGDGLYNSNSSPVIQNSIFWGDGTQEIVNADASSIPTVTDSIVAGGCPDATSLCTRILTSNPALGVLRANGGFTKTRALGAGSPAIDAGGVNAACAAKDQRGVARPQGGKCDIGAYEVKAMAFGSAGGYDGQVLESGENSGSGGTANSSGATIRIGDDSSNRQYRGFLSFNTSGLPDGATLVLARLKIKKSSIVGAPFTGLGTLRMDVQKPYFGTGLPLVTSDFQAAATAPGAGKIMTPAVLGWYAGLLDSTGRANISKTGTTQLRLKFGLDDDDDHANDYLAIVSGNATTVSNRPVLTVYYNP